MTQKTQRWLSGLILVIFTGLSLYLGWVFYHIGAEQIKLAVAQAGSWGWLCLILLQVIQIVIAVVPGEFIELGAGIAYGVWGGLVLCLLGVVLGEALVLFLVRRFGQPLLCRLFPRSDLRRFAFLRSHHQLQLIIFILFLIPGTPKDVLTYVVGLTSIKARDFLLLSTVARIPSIITSTLIGANVMAGNYTVSFIIFGLTLILGLGGIYLNNKVIKRQTQKPTTKRLPTSTKT